MYLSHWTRERKIKQYPAYEQQRINRIQMIEVEIHVEHLLTGLTLVPACTLFSFFPGSQKIR